MGGHPGQATWPAAVGGGLRELARGLRGLPRLCQAGLVLFGAGGAGDLVYHASPAHLAAALTPLLGAEAGRAHLVTLAGMVAILVSVVWRGLRRRVDSS